MIKALAITLALASPAGAFELAFPVDCALGTTCYVQNYVDHDESPKVQDFTCGGLSYDGHDGTDIGLPTIAMMRAGVNVLAAAPGTVKGIRDGIADFAPVEPNKECGNGVLLDHGGGWETQYCHMKQGSVQVRVGEEVAPGAILGQIGQSGKAAFPHLHLSVRRNGVELDPFAPETLKTCGVPTEQDLWDHPFAYAPGGLLDAGISSEIPQFQSIKDGLASPNLPQTAPALVIWAYFFGPRAGDALLFTLTGPEGTVFTERSGLEKPQALAFRAVGRKLKTSGWSAGIYKAQVKMMRGDQELGRKTVEISIGQ